MPPRSDLYEIDLLPPGDVSVAVPALRLTSDHRSTAPVSRTILNHSENPATPS